MFEDIGAVDFQGFIRSKLCIEKPGDLAGLLARKSDSDLLSEADRLAGIVHVDGRKIDSWCGNRRVRLAANEFDSVVKQSGLGRIWRAVICKHDIVDDNSAFS